MSDWGRVWLAGASGFLGSHTAACLSEDAVLVSKSGGSVNGRTILAVDILDEQQVASSAAGCQSAILCTGMVSRDPDDAGRLHQLHVEGTRAALRGLRSAGVRRVVVASTSGTLAVGTNPTTIFDEDSPSVLKHISGWPYYRSKYYAEREALSFNASDFEVIIACPSLLLGPGDLRESSTSDVRRFLEKSVPVVPAGGLAFVDVRDAAAGLVKALGKGRAGERYLLNAANMTLATFFGRLSRVSGVPAPVLRMPKHKGLSLGLFSMYDKALRAMGGVPPVDAHSIEMAQHFWYCSSAKAERELGFVARDPVETLRDTVLDLFERNVVAPPEMRRRS